MNQKSVFLGNIIPVDTISSDGWVCESCTIFDRKKLRPLNVQNAHNNKYIIADHKRNTFITSDATSVHV